MTAAMPSSSTADQGSRWLIAALAASLATAGIIHCALIPDHFARSTIFGLGFLGAGIAQLGLAGLVVIRPGRMVYAAIIAVSLLFMGLYAFNVMVGLPFHASADQGAVVEEAAHGEGSTHGESATHGQGTTHGESGLVVGIGEPVDALGAGTQLAQLAAIAFAATLLRGSRIHARGVRA